MKQKEKSKTGASLYLRKAGAFKNRKAYNRKSKHKGRDQ